MLIEQVNSDNPQDKLPLVRLKVYVHDVLLCDGMYCQSMLCS